MIPLNTEIHLGWKAFVLMFLKTVAVAALLVIVASLISVFRASIIQGFSMMMENGSLSSENAFYLTQQLSNISVALYLLAVLVFLVGLIITALEYSFYAYTLQEFDLKMKKGVLYRREISIPYRQIQDVNIERPLLYIILGMSILVIMTAGTIETHGRETSKILLEPIDKDAAEEILSKLQREIGVQVVETEGEADREYGVKTV
jgi:uncharacterized membrane protein YdbT with pleckstrin-like domain